jgi:hypothetical protein
MNTRIIVCLALLVASISGCLPTGVTFTPQRPSPTMASPTITLSPTSIKVTQLVSGVVQEAFWSPDGMSIYYLTEHATANTSCCIREWRRLDLLSMHTEIVKDVPVRTGESHNLPWLDVPVSGQQISPDGNHVIYLRKPEGYHPPNPLPPMYVDPLELWSAKLDGSEAISLWKWEKGCGSIIAVEWFSDNGTAIVICSGFEGGVFERAVVSIDGAKAQPFNEWAGISNSERRESLDIYGVPGYVVQLSPDNSKVAFTRGNGELWLSFPYAQPVLNKIAHVGFLPQWSPDGKRLYFFVIGQLQPDEVPNLVVYTWPLCQDHRSAKLRCEKRVVE